MEGKKKKFSAAMPYKLAYMIKNQKRELEKKEINIKKIISNLQIYVDKDKSDLKVEILSGVDGFETCQKMILNSEPDEIFELTSINQAEKFFPSNGFEQDIRSQICKKHHVKTIYSSDNFKSKQRKNVEMTKLDDKEFSIGSEVIIFKDKIIFNTYNDQLQTIVISDVDIALSLKTMFKALWFGCLKNDE
jgi:hypothetical protein